MYGFVGGFTGSYISKKISEHQYIKDKMIDTNQVTRINIKLNYQGETEINGTGTMIDNKYIDQLEVKLKN